MSGRTSGFVVGDFWTDVERSVSGSAEDNESKLLGIDGLIEDAQAAILKSAEKLTPTKKVSVS